MRPPHHLLGLLLICVGLVASARAQNLADDDLYYDEAEARAGSGDGSGEGSGEGEETTTPEEETTTVVPAGPSVVDTQVFNIANQPGSGFTVSHLSFNQFSDGSIEMTLHADAAAGTEIDPEMAPTVYLVKGVPDCRNFPTSGVYQGLPLANISQPSERAEMTFTDVTFGEVTSSCPAVLIQKSAAPADDTTESATEATTTTTTTTTSTTTTTPFEETGGLSGRFDSETTSWLSSRLSSLSSKVSSKVSSWLPSWMTSTPTWASPASRARRSLNDWWSSWAAGRTSASASAVNTDYDYYSVPDSEEASEARAWEDREARLIPIRNVQRSFIPIDLSGFTLVASGSAFSISLAPAVTPIGFFSSGGSVSSSSPVSVWPNVVLHGVDNSVLFPIAGLIVAFYVAVAYASIFLPGLGSAAVRRVSDSFDTSTPRRMLRLLNHKVDSAVDDLADVVGKAVTRFTGKVKIRRLSDYYRRDG